LPPQKFSINHATQLFITTEKDLTPYPLPAGAPQGCYAKGQPDTPINQHNQGKVMTVRIEKTVFISGRRSPGMSTYPSFKILWIDIAFMSFDYALP
jgi:hypothetical protein